MLIDRNKSELVKKAVEIMSEYKDIVSAASILGWDQETYMPSMGAEHRADQLSTLYGLAHRHLISPKSKELAESIKANIDVDTEYEKDLLLLFVKDFEKAKKIPEDLVRKLAQASSACLEKWKQAKNENNWKLFEYPLSELLKLKIEEAGYLGYQENIYDAMLDEHEPGLKTSSILPIYDNLKLANKNLIERFSAFEAEPFNSSEPFESQKQMELAKEVSALIGFDYTCGRIDSSSHPFTTGFTPNDVRITTRTNKNNIFECLFAAIHETGHGLYEQSINCSLYRTLACDGASLGIHESQSLFWENIIGRSLPFIQFLKPILNRRFPNSFILLNHIDLYKQLNIVKPNLIRIESDELTYIYHIILRVEIEIELVNGRIQTKDIPDIWNSKMQKYLGIKPSNYSNGALQDIHWAVGSFGYFPAYLLGKLYAASFYKKMKDTLNVDELVINGEFHHIRKWMKDNILKYGRLKEPAELVSPIIPQGLNSEDFIEYMNNKADTLEAIQ